MKCSIKNSFVLFLWGFKIQMKMSFMVKEIWLYGFGKIFELFQMILYKLCSKLSKSLDEISYKNW